MYIGLYGILIDFFKSYVFYRVKNESQTDSFLTHFYHFLPF
jgi:hypothetical protein